MSRADSVFRRTKAELLPNTGTENHNALMSCVLFLPRGCTASLSTKGFSSTERNRNKQRGRERKTEFSNVVSLKHTGFILM